MAWDLPLSLRPYRQGFSLRKGQNLLRSSCASSLAGDRRAPGAASLCAGLRGRGRVEGGQLGRACGCRTRYAPPNQKAVQGPSPPRPRGNRETARGCWSVPSTPTQRNRGALPTLLAGSVRDIKTTLPQKGQGAAAPPGGRARAAVQSYVVDWHMTGRPPCPRDMAGGWTVARHLQPQTSKAAVQEQAGSAGCSVPRRPRRLPSAALSLLPPT